MKGPGQRTVRMPHIRQKLHFRRREGVVFRKLELGGEYTAFEWCALGALNKCFPEEHVIFGYWAGGYAFWGVGAERFVLFEKTLGGGIRHDVCMWGGEVCGLCAVRYGRPIV